MDKVMDYSLNGGPLYKEVVSAIYDMKKCDDKVNIDEKNNRGTSSNINTINILNYIYGIGGRDIGVDDIEEIFEDISKNTDNNEKIRYVGLKQEEKCQYLI